MAGEGIVKTPKTHSKMRATKRFEDLNADYHLPMKKTGLPFIVWISPRGNARHDVRVEVAFRPKAGKPELVSVAILPDVRVVKGMMGGSALACRRRWGDLKRDVIVKFWNNEIRCHWDAAAAIKPVRIKEVRKELAEFPLEEGKGREGEEESAAGD